MNIVITGGPGAGKTTLIEELRARGYAISGESAQIFMTMIEGLLGGPLDQLNWRTKNQPFSQVQISEISLIQGLLVGQLFKTNRLSAADLIFTDRGLHDSLTYLLSHNTSPSPALVNACQNIIYDWVFVLEPPPPNLFKTAPGRATTTHAQSDAIGKNLQKDYSQLKAKGQVTNQVVYVPWNSNRIDTIFNHLNPAVKAKPLSKLKTGNFLKNILVSIDQLGNALSGGNPDNTVSARVGYFAFTTTNYKRYYWTLMESIINFTFWPVDGPIIAGKLIHLTALKRTMTAEAIFSVAYFAFSS